MNAKTKSISSWQLISDLDERLLSSCTYMRTTASKFPLQTRRAIVQHIIKCRDGAKTHQDIPIFANELRGLLIHDFWGELKSVSSASAHKKHLEDFAVIATIDAPAHHPIIQEVLHEITPEDMPRRTHKKSMQLQETLRSHNEYKP